MCICLASGGAQFVGIELYTKLRDYLENHLEAIRPVSLHEGLCAKDLYTRLWEELLNTNAHTHTHTHTLAR